MDAAADFGFLWVGHAQTTADTLLIRSGPGVLHTVCLNKAAGAQDTGDLTLYDGVDAGGTVIAAWDMALIDQPVCLTFDLAFTTGLFLSGAATIDGWQVTVTYR
jgi:hypothetical protein